MKKQEKEQEVKKTNVKSVKTKKETTNVSKKANAKQKSVKKAIPDEHVTDEVKKLGILLGIIIAVICVFYLITVIVTKNSSSLKYTSTGSEESQIQYDDILASNILSQDKDEYYVLIENKESSFITLFEQYISTYSEKDDSLKIYTVDLNNAFNKKYKSDETTLEGDYKFAGNTLLKISDGEITESFTSNDTINSKLSELAS